MDGCNSFVSGLQRCLFATFVACIWFTLSCTRAIAQSDVAPKEIKLPSGQQLSTAVPGDPRRVNSLPMSFAVSPDGRWLVSVDAGYGTYESGYMQSLSVLDTRDGSVRDFPDTRTSLKAKQTLYSGLAFSADGTHIYASLASLSDPEGKVGNDSGSGIAVYSFLNGVPSAQRFLKLPLVSLGAGRYTDLLKSSSGNRAVPYPAAIEVIPGTQKLLVAENLSDTVAVVDTQTGALEFRFDLSQTANVPSTYPIALAVSKDGTRAFVALWNGSEVAELDLSHLAVVRHVALMKPRSPTAPGTHPCALLLDERSGILYVALSNRDAVAAIRIGKAAAPRLEVAGYFDTRLPGQSYFGAEPNALAESTDGSRLYVANMGSNAIAVLDTRKLRPLAKAKGLTEPIGFVPTEWMPIALASSGGNLYVATGKGKGVGPNNMPQRLTEPTSHISSFKRSFTYAPTLLYGSIAAINEQGIGANLKAATENVLVSNRMRAAEEKMQFARSANPIKHVIYIIKENRTYDQLFGDLTKNGTAVGNGDPSLTMYGEAITPNQHKLALQFGVLDNFFDSGEVSGQGHVWSNAAIGTDYLEKTWQQNYRGEQRSYDYEGMVAEGYPLQQHIPDVNEPASGYLWTNFAAHGKSVYHFGEYISSVFCTDKNAPRPTANPQQGAMSGGEQLCGTPVIAHGKPLPAEWGGGMNRWPWSIPRLASNIATKPELIGHFAEESPDFNLRIPDQIRVNVFLRHLEQWKRDAAQGRDTMPNFIQLRLPNDHTEGTRAGGPTPRASIADNDLAIGRAVEAISHSSFWNDTAFFILEDDAQNGADHVDAHRSIALVISKYSPHAPTGQPAFVDSRFYSTVSVIRTMETLLGAPPMNNNDAFASVIGSLFTGPGDQEPFRADGSNRDNGLIYAANAPSAPGSAESRKMDFRHADRADSDKLNLILWRDAKGDAAPPSMLLEKHQRKKDDDD